MNVGAILGMTTDMLVMLYGQTRIMFAMSRDGLVPKVLSKVHPKYKTPYISILAIISCGALILNLQSQTFIRFVIWLVIGLAVYFLYSRKSSLLNHDSENNRMAL